MKKTFIAICATACLLASADASARGPHRNHYHGPRYDTGIELSVGYLHSGYRTRNEFNDDVTKDGGLNGLSLGVTKDFTLVNNTLYLQTGLAYEFQTNSKRYTHEMNLKVVQERSEHYLDIPLRIKFAMDVFPEMRAFIYLGPTLDFGLSAKLQGRLRGEGETMGKVTYNYFTGKLKGDTIGNFTLPAPASRYRAFDVFMGGALGVELYDIAVVKFGFDWGLINKNKSQEIADNFTTHRNLFHLGVGVRF